MEFRDSIDTIGVDAPVEAVRRVLALASEARGAGRLAPTPSPSDAGGRAPWRPVARPLPAVG